MQLSPHETGRTQATLSSWWSMMWFIILPQMDNTINVFMGGACGLQYILWLLWCIHMRLFCCWFVQKNINRRQTGDKTENQNAAVTHRRLCVYCKCQGQPFVSPFKSCRRVGATSDVSNTLSHGAAPQHNHKPAGDRPPARRSWYSIWCLTGTEHKHPAASQISAEK